MTFHVTLFQLNSTCEVELIEHLFKVPPNCNFAECQTTVISSRDIARDLVFLRLASFPINLEVLFALDWSFTILKAPSPRN